MTVGLQQPYYSTVEGQGPVELCVSILSGDIADNTFVVNYYTIDGLAEGILCTHIQFCCCACKLCFICL